MLSGAGVIDKGASEKIVHITVDGEIQAGTGSGNASILVKKEAFAGYTPIAPATNTTTDIEYGLELNVYAMVLDNNGQVVDYLGDQEITQPTSRPTAGQDWTIQLKGPLKDLDTTAAGDQTYAGYLCRVDCYAITTAKVTTLTVDADNFGGTFYIEAETLFRDEATGHDFPATFIIPKGKISGNFTFNMASSGDPSTFDFTIDCTVGAVRTLDSSKRVLYAIDIIDNISTTEAHSEAPGVTKDYSAATATSVTRSGS